MSNVSYFGTGGTADAPAADNNCACDPDNCYNPDFPNVSIYKESSLPPSLPFSLSLSFSLSPSLSLLLSPITLFYLYTGHLL